MTNTQTLYQERVQNRKSLLAGRLPRRVPLFPYFTIEAACGLAGIDLHKAHYDFDLMEKAYRSVCETFASDTFPISNSRFPAIYQMLGSKNWVMASGGAMQHPEIEVMLPEEYDALIHDPYGTIAEKMLPRICSSLRGSPASQSFTLARAYGAFCHTQQQHAALAERLAVEYEYAPGYATGKKTAAPFDFIADQLRGFKGITMDIRRIPDKVEQAVNAILPLMIQQGTPTALTPGFTNFVPLHLAPFINLKHFERLYWPTFKVMVEELDKKGVACCLNAEQDFTRYAGYLAQLPESTILLFESGDAAHIKQTAGKRHVMGGFYDPTITIAKSKEACIDEAKRLLEKCMEGGRFYFAFDRNIMDIKSVDVPKLQAVLEWVRANATY